MSHMGTYIHKLTVIDDCFAVARWGEDTRQIDTREYSFICVYCDLSVMFVDATLRV